MELLMSNLPSGGYGYDFPSIQIKPMTFLEITEYLENIPSDPLEKYLFEIRYLAKDDPKIYECYVMDIDFLIFYKRLITVSGEGMSYEISVPCPECKKTIKKSINIQKDIHFKQIDDKIMNGAVISVNGNNYDISVPRVKDFLKVFEKYLIFKKIKNLDMIKIISLVSNSEFQLNQIEEDFINATHEDITLLMMLKDIYFDRVEPIELFCPNCNKGKSAEERRGITISVNSLVVDFFREIFNNCPVDGSKILFK